MLAFWDWVKEKSVLQENDFRTGAKLGLYPDIVDALGQSPPLYGIPKAADLITYIYSAYGEKGPPCDDKGYYWPHNVQIPSLDGFTPRYTNTGAHRHERAAAKAGKWK